MTSKFLLAGGLLLLPAVALAGGCPAGKGGVDVRAADATPAKGVADHVLTTIDVAREPAGFAGRSFRLRRLDIAAGGIVPWHSHADRPAIIYVVSGEVTEYASNCSVPIVHRAGEAVPELHGVSHWWKNTGKGAAVLLSSDLLKVGDDAKAM